MHNKKLYVMLLIVWMARVTDVSTICVAWRYVAWMYRGLISRCVKQSVWHLIILSYLISHSPSNRLEIRCTNHPPINQSTLITDTNGSLLVGDFWVCTFSSLVSALYVTRHDVTWVLNFWCFGLINLQYHIVPWPSLNFKWKNLALLLQTARSPN